MEYLADDYADIARRMREVARGGCIQWALWHDADGFKCWIALLSDGRWAAAYATSNSKFNPTIFESHDVAVEMLSKAPHGLKEGAVTVREYPPG